MINVLSYKTSINKLKTIYYLLICFLVILSCNSCVSDLPFDNRVESIPVVNCLLTGNDSIQRLSLTSSIKTGEKLRFKEITDAVITLNINDTLVGKFNRTSSDNWQLKYIPLGGKKYSLKVLLSDGKVLTASTTMPTRNYIVQNTNIDKFPSKNFIQYSTYSPTWMWIIRSDSLLQSSSLPNSKDMMRDEIGTDHILADKFNMDGNLLNFIPTADTPKFRFYVRLESNSDATNGIQFKIQSNYSFHTYICFRTSSVEYDKYLKSTLQKLLMRMDPSDPAIWFDESSVYSNITNGVGIFGAYNDKYFRYNDDNSYFGL